MSDPGPRSPDPAPVAGADPTPWGLALLFLKIGTIGFGGGMAVIALIERELVQRRRLVTPGEYLHGVALGQLLGPFALNAAFFIGYRRHGLRGALLASLGFLLPSVCLVTLLSALYFRFHRLPALAGVLAGLGPVVVSLILSAALSTGKRVLTSGPAWGVAGAGLAASLAKVSPALTLLAAGAIGILFGARAFPGGGSPRPRRTPASQRRSPRRRGWPTALGLMPLVAGSSGAASGVGLATIALTFFKVGLVFFGGGFVLVAVLSRQLVHDLRWLSPREFLDGVAISSLTPGPIAVLSTFAGYKLAGVAGALLATGALLAPCLLLMSVLCGGYDYFRRSDRFADFMSGVSPAVVGLITSAAALLWSQAIPSWRALLLAVASGVLLLRFRWHPAFVLILGAFLAAIGVVP